MERSRQIEDDAAAWLARRESEAWTSADDASLVEWLDAAVANRVAYLRLEAAWEQAHRLHALGAGTQPGMVPPPGAWHVSPFFERRQETVDCVRAPRPFLRVFRPKMFGLAAGLLLVVGCCTYLLRMFDQDRYETPVGGIASIPLQDGSSVTLNTASEIRVTLTQQERLIKLEGGEAFFDVAKDAARPFIVEAGSRRVIAVGTKFAVRREDDVVQIVVTEGRVRFEDASMPADQQLGRPGGPPPTLLAAGAIARTSAVALLVQKKTPRDAEEAVGWRTGYLTFDTVPLAEAIAEFNRYTPRKILIEDQQLAALQVSGKFRATNAGAFIRVLRDGFGIQARETDGHILLTQ